MTDVQGHYDDSDRPETLGRLLRALRIAARLNQSAVAESTGLSQSQISRAEQDRRRLSPEQVARIADACGAGAQEKERLVALAEASAREHVDARAILQRGAHSFQERIRRYEEDSAFVRAYQPGMVLGQLQTTAYARAVFAVRADRAAAEVDRLTAQRMQRSALLRDPVRRWEFIQTEGALSWSLHSAAVMAEQMDHLATLSELPNVDLRIIPAFQPARFTAPHGFHIYDAEVVQIGTKNATALLADRDDVVTYATLFTELSTLAVQGDAARDILARLGAEYRKRA
jgi:transcriptional regulator with XRE-family HTH domain